MSRVLVVLYLIGAVIAATGVYLAFAVDRFLGAGMILVGAALFIIPLTKQRY